MYLCDALETGLFVFGTSHTSNVRTSQKRGGRWKGIPSLVKDKITTGRKLNSPLHFKNC